MTYLSLPRRRAGCDRQPRGVSRRLVGANLLLVAVLAASIVVGPPAARADPASSPAAGGNPASRATMPAWARSGNGQLDVSALHRVAGVQLAPDAAEAFSRMLEAARRDGVRLAVTDGYRSYVAQVELKRRKGWLAARPGTSMHGWGVAVDFDTRVTDFAWLREHAATYGWIHPAWAQPGGSKPEPWHWEYVGPIAVTEPSSRGGAAGSVPTFEPGELVASVRFERKERRAGRWFDVHAGLDGLRSGARHYPGTAGPGEIGNFAVAGFQRTNGAPLLGMAWLAPGDLVHVRTPAGVEHVYVVVDRDQLSAADGWALGPDPLGVGATRLLTLTSAARDGGLSVVWAQGS
jgi:hypothetical protein